MDKWIVNFFDPDDRSSDGDFVGPFDSETLAVEYAKKECDRFTSWVVHRLEPAGVTF